MPFLLLWTEWARGSDSFLSATATWTSPDRNCSPNSCCQPELPELPVASCQLPVASCQLPPYLISYILNQNCPIFLSILNQRGSATFHQADWPAPHFLCCQGEINKDACCQPELPINAVFAVSATLLSNVCCCEIYNTLKIWKSCWYQNLLN